MLVMNLVVDNLFAFNNFNINFSYPKKIVNSTIENEHLVTKPNFRYKKVNIIMGANASGKTSLGLALMSIFNFMSRRNIDFLYKHVRKKSLNASFEIDFLVDEDSLYRVVCNIIGKSRVESEQMEIDIDIYKVNIRKNDSYESCIKRLKKVDFEQNTNDIEKLKILPNYGWAFSLTQGEKMTLDMQQLDLKVLEIVLQALDTDIVSVKPLDEVKNSFIIHKKDDSIIIQEGEVIRDNKLSSGTRAGLQVADMISSIKMHNNGFYYCDEKFSFIHSDIEKALLSIMISLLNNREQLFFTSHNMELLEMDLPKHSFTFLRKKDDIEVVYPDSYIKKNDISLYNAVKNDVFNCNPSVDKIYELENL